MDAGMEEFINKVTEGLNIDYVIIVVRDTGTAEILSFSDKRRAKRAFQEFYSKREPRVMLLKVKDWAQTN
jgi:hypothetical protein